MPEPLTVEPTGAKELGPCECCGNITRRVWGLANRGTAAEAAYFVEWTAGAIARHGAHFDLIIGRWGEDATSAHRVAVSLAFRHTAEGPQFMVIDASERPTAGSNLVGRAMSRSDVLDTPLAAQAFAIVDAIWLHDNRIAELTKDAA